MTAADFRANFPYLAERVYLNSAGAGLSSVPVIRAAAAFHENAKLRGIDGQMDWREMTERTRAKLAERLHTSPEMLGFHSSATEAMNLIAASLALGSRASVLVAHDDHPAVWRPWEAASVTGRVKLSLVETPVSAPREQILMAAAKYETPKVIALSHVDWRTGAQIDLEMLSRFCRARDILLVVDGSQAAGAIAVDATLADAYLGSTFKWLLAGFGLGYLAVSRRLRAQLTPAFRGYFNPPPSQDLRYGHLNMGVINELQASLGLLNTADQSGLADRPEQLATLLRQRLADDGYKLHTPASHAGIISIACADAARAANILASAGVSVQAHPGALRFSPHIYNTDLDLDRCLRALPAALKA